MSHVVDSDLHYKMCFVTIEGVAAGREPVCRRVRAVSANSLLWCVLPPPAMFALSSWMRKKKRKKKKTEGDQEREKIVLCSRFQQQCLLVYFSFMH